MKSALIVLTVGAMLTVEQRDVHRANQDAPSSAVSADGRFVAFTTYSQLVAADTDGESDVYVLDRATQQVTFESPDIPGYRSDSSYPGISGDGRFIVYERSQHVFLHDRQEDVTTNLGEGKQPAIAGNGRVVFFSAGQSDSAAGVDVNGGKSDIYAVDLAVDKVERVSVDLHGIDPNIVANVTPSASTDGRYVGFASNRQGKPGLHSPIVFVRDTMRQVTTLVGSGWNPSLSGDGRFVAFAGLSKRIPHIFVADLQTGETRIITNSIRRGLANGPSAKPAMSSNGRFVAFQSEANDLVAVEDFNLLWDVFVMDRTTNVITRLSGDRDEAWMEPSTGPSIDATGSIVAFSSRHPTGVSDKGNDFDLYVASVHAATLASVPWESRSLLARAGR